MTDWKIDPLFDAATMRPMFGGRQLRPGFEVSDTADPMPLFWPAIEAERDRIANLAPAAAMRENGADELPTTKKWLTATGELNQLRDYIYACACRITTVLDRQKRPGQSVVVIEADDDYWATMQSGRLASGSHGGHVYDSWFEALASANTLAAL